MAKITIILALAFVAVVAAAPQSIQQRQIVPGPNPVNADQRPAAANPEQAKDLEASGSIGYGYYGGYGYPAYGYSSSLYYGGLGGYGYGGYGYGYPYYTRGFGGLYGGYWY
ncbi:cuticle protein 6.4-like [Culicoides brevitarsis]|uniref:cuticle protein 6.4-like n=1 Tax=Culicoides brevitarsis TaxID=469753 RepID=UPI00307C73C3